MKEVFSRTKGLSDKTFHYCPGCHHGIIHRLIAEASEEMGLMDRTVGVPGIGCAGLSLDYYNFDAVLAPHGRAPAVATGIKRARPHALVYTYQGDGDAGSIGAAEIVHAAVRGENITTIFVNNANYGMTGGQMAPTTLLGQKTTTSPFGREVEWSGYPLDVPLMLSTIKGAVYVASVSVDTPKNILEAKKCIKKAFQVQLDGLGYSFVSILSICPTNWHMTPVDAVKWLQENLKKQYTLGELRTPEMAK